MALMLYVLVLLVAYPGVTLLGRTLDGAAYGRFGPTGVGQAERLPTNTINKARAPSYYQEPPYNRLIGAMYRDGMLPLWNPYAGGGQPLAAQYSPRAFFPYQIVENIAPWVMKDFFTLGRMWLAAIGTFLLLRAMRASPSAAFLGGLLYMLSGAFVWFAEHEEVVNPAMMAPYALLTVHAAIGRPSRFSVACLALAVSGLLLAGQPESALFVALLAGSYGLLLLWERRTRTREVLQAIATILVGTSLGLLIASPLLVVFFELVSEGYTIHPAHGDMGTQDPTPAAWALAVVIPTLFDTPTPERVMPINGVWEYLGGYSGVVPLVLIAGALGRKHELARSVAFFAGAGALILLKNVGLEPFALVGELPLLNQAWSNVWAGPTWSLSIALAAALSWDIVTQHPPSFVSAVFPPRIGRYAIVVASVASLLLVVNAWLVLSTDWAWDLYRGAFPVPQHLLSVPSDRAYFLPSVGGGLLATGLAAMAAGYILASQVDVTRRSVAMSVLIVAVGWFYIPRGYDARGQYVELLILVLGLAATWFIVRLKGQIAAATLVGAVAVAMVWEIASPHGAPLRRDAFEAPKYVQFLKERAGNDRIMATDGLLLPNAAGVYGLQDVRFANWVNVRAIHTYAALLRGDPVQTKGSSSDGDTTHLFFTGTPPQDYAFDGDDGFASVLDLQRPYYSFLGVKYFIVRPDQHLARATLVYEDDDVWVYENLDALPRAFVTQRVETISSPLAAQLLVSRVGSTETEIFSVERPTTIEMNGSDRLAPATITSYASNQVEVRVTTHAPGLLVLTDTHYPGWRAQLDGRGAPILRVNGLVRGVEVPAGEHTVVFKYKPQRFYIAAGFAGVAGIAVVLLFLSHARAARSRPH